MTPSLSIKLIHSFNDSENSQHLFKSVSLTHLLRDMFVSILYIPLIWSPSLFCPARPDDITIAVYTPYMCDVLQLIRSHYTRIHSHIHTMNTHTLRRSLLKHQMHERALNMTFSSNSRGTRVRTAHFTRAIRYANSANACGPRCAHMRKHNMPLRQAAAARFPPNGDVADADDDDDDHVA